MKQCLVTGIILPDGKTADIVVKNCRLVGVDTRAAVTLNTGYETIDAVGLQALPGLADTHTHLRQPGGEDAETVVSGTLAATHGGYTCVHAILNTIPMRDNVGIVERVQHLGTLAGRVEVHPVGAISTGLAGEHLADLGAMDHSAMRVSVFSDDGKCVSGPALMRRVLECVKTFNRAVAQHAQDSRLIEGSQMNESPLPAETGLTGQLHVAEEAATLHDIQLTAHLGSRPHVCYLSMAGPVDIVRRAKTRGTQVTMEATPHHIALIEELTCSYDPRYKVNPPLCTSEDVAVMVGDLVDGVIDYAGTDHAPHPLGVKDCEWQAGAFGMIGLEAVLPVVRKVLVDMSRTS